MASNLKTQKYKNDLEQIEHHYQNQLEQKVKQTSAQSQQPVRQQTPHVAAQSSHRVTRSPSITSSILMQSDGKSCSFFILILAVLFQFVSIVTICITFIFPFWALFQIDLPVRTLLDNGYLNITNPTNSISLTADNSTNGEFPSIVNLDQIKFEMGLWEIKTNRKLNIYLNDYVKSNINTENSKSMRWPTDSASINTHSFIYLYMSLIELPSANVFTVQILEILHFVFTILTFCTTSVTLCLCTNKKASLAWYLVCFLLCLLSLMLGTAVLVTIAAWRAALMPNLSSVQKLTLLKDFGFCYWLSVTVQVLLFISSVFLMAYVIIAAIAMYKKSKEDCKKLNKKQNGFSNVLRIPRLQVSSTGSIPNAKASQDPAKDINSPINAFSNLQQVPETQHSYVFYTGHGNFHKQPTTNGVEYEQANDFFQPPPEHLVNYSLMMQNRRIQKSNDHPYSNVLVEQINHAYHNGQR